MRINSKEVLFGQPILKIREVVKQAMLQRLRSTNRNEILSLVAKILKKSDSEAEQVIIKMIEEEYLTFKEKPVFDNLIEHHLTASVKGRRFGIATASPPLSREKATRLLNELIERAKSINGNDDLVYYVENLCVFGSYLSEVEILSDLDVGFKLVQKYLDDEFDNKSQARIDLAFEKGRHFRDFLDRLSWPQKEIILMLKAKQIGLGLHDQDVDKVFKVTESKIVYQYKVGQNN